MSFCDKGENFIRWVVSLYSLSCSGCFVALSFIDRERDLAQAEFDERLIKDTKP